VTSDDVVPMGDDPPEEVSAADDPNVRAWARSVGLPVAERGRVSDKLHAAYAAFHAYEGRRNPG